jgi:hypothetical protein
LPLSAFYLFAAIETIHIPLVSAVFTDWGFNHLIAAMNQFKPGFASG